MTTPRTIAGRAALSGMRPHVKRALAQTIVAIETEAVSPYLDALREADAALETLAALDAASTLDPAAMTDIARRAEAARRRAGPLLAERGPAEPG